MLSKKQEILEIIEVDFPELHKSLIKKKSEKTILEDIKNYYERKINEVKLEETEQINLDFELLYEEISSILEIINNNQIIMQNIEIINLTIEIEKISKFLSGKIDSCLGCSEILRTEEREDIKIVKSLDIDDFINNYISNYKLGEEIKSKLECSNCGNSNLIRIITKDEMDNFSRMVSFLEQFGIEITKLELEKFQNYLRMYPMLAFKNITGKKIMEAIKISFDKQKVILCKKTKLYRGRKRKQDEKKYLKDQLKMPPERNTGHGRYNFIGESILYCTNDIKQLPEELDLSFNEEIDVVSLVLKEDVKIFPINEIFENFQENFMQCNVESHNLKEKYLLTNYVSQCVKNVGYNGIEYNSIADDDVINYAFFSEKIVKYSNQIKTYNFKTFFNKNKNIPFNFTKK